MPDKGETVGEWEGRIQAWHAAMVLQADAAQRESRDRYKSPWEVAGQVAMSLAYRSQIRH